MKHKNKLFLSIFLLCASNQVFAMGSALPTLQSITTIISVLRGVGSPVSQPTAESLLPTLLRQLPITINPEPPAVREDGTDGANNSAYVEQIKLLAEDSKCADYSWKGRGTAPIGYIGGVALSYSRSLCRLKTKSPFSSIMGKVNFGSSIKDALTHYQSNFSNLIPIASAGKNALRAIYTLGMGLGMRESSGNYCEGWDRSAGANRSSSAAEAGVFQTSFDSITANSELSKLYAEYKANPNLCLKDVFKQGARCSSSNNLGTGPGADFQAFNKSCPAFATEYAMILLRVQRSHYGPINRKEAEVVPACNNLLKDVEDLINNDPYACDDIL